MNYYKLKIKQQPKTWEKYGIINANPDMEEFTRWFFHTRGLTNDDIVIETTDQDILFFAMKYGERYQLERIDIAQAEDIRIKRKHHDERLYRRDEHDNGSGL